MTIIIKYINESEVNLIPQRLNIKTGYINKQTGLDDLAEDRDWGRVSGGGQDEADEARSSARWGGIRAPWSTRPEAAGSRGTRRTRTPIEPAAAEQKSHRISYLEIIFINKVTSYWWEIGDFRKVN